MIIFNHRKKHITILLISLLLLSIPIYFTGCINNIKSKNLMKGVSAKAISARPLDDKFISNTAEFSINLFKKTVKDKDNSLISPLSAMAALSMTANGADKETLSQMEKVLGGDIPLNERNEYLHSYMKCLPDTLKNRMKVANSIWYRNNGIEISKKFLQKNIDYYDATIYQSNFDHQTVKDINNWVRQKTEGRIKKILHNINSDSEMYLINALAFDAKWEETYTKDNVSKDRFYSANGKDQSVDFMYSLENSYLDDGKATGFIKPYFNDKYEFVALLPKEDVSIDDYMKSLSGKGFINTIKSAEPTSVGVYLPKFQYDDTICMNKALINLGMTDCFLPEKADFSRMSKSSGRSLYVGYVLQSTYISVDTKGTRAAAETHVTMKTTGTGDIIRKNVKLDRPFVYAIIDSKTKLPIFMGTVMNL